MLSFVNNHHYTPLGIQDDLSKISGGSVLDVKTGQGGFISYIQQFKNFEKITAIDRNLEIDALYKRFKNLPVVFLEVDSRNMIFPDEFFDTVCISNSLHHMSDIGQTLQEMKRVLKKGGLFVIKEIFLDSSSEQEKSFLMYHHWCAKKEQITLGEYHHEPYTKKKVLNVIDELKLGELVVKEYNMEINGLNRRLPAHTPLKFRSVLDHIYQTIDDLQQRKKFPEIVTEGVEVIKQIEKYGFQSAPFVFVTGRKID